MKWRYKKADNQARNFQFLSGNKLTTLLNVIDIPSLNISDQGVFT